MKLDNDRWYESLGEAVDRVAKSPLTPIEKGKVLEGIYRVMMSEAERDAREERNK